MRMVVRLFVHYITAVTDRICIIFDICLSEVKVQDTSNKSLTLFDLGDLPGDCKVKPQSCCCFIDWEQHHLQKAYILNVFYRHNERHKQNFLRKFPLTVFLLCSHISFSTHL